MQNRRFWEGGSQSELEDVCRRKVAIRSFIEAGWSTYAEQIILPSNRAAAAASSLQTVYDLAAKRRVGLRFNGADATLVQARYLRYSAQIDDKSVISRKPFARFEQGNASTRVQDGPGLDHGSSRPKLCYLSGVPTHLALAP